MKTNQADCFLYFATPIGTYLIATMAGSWWVDMNLGRGIICLVGLIVLTIQTGYREYLSGEKKHFYFVYAAPLAISVISFSYGLIKVYWLSVP